MVSGDDFLQSLQVLAAVPLMVVIGEQSLSASEAEMEALASPNLQSARLTGFLGFHEAYAAEVAGLLLPFLR